MDHSVLTCPQCEWTGAETTFEGDDDRSCPICLRALPTT